MNDELIYYRYRLFDDPLTPASRMSLEGTILQKKDEKTDGWFTTRTQVPSLEKHIRSANNPIGFVEYQEYDPMKNEVSFTPSINGPDVYYSRDELYLMERKELERAAKGVNLSPFAVKSEFLIKKILVEQKKFQDRAKEKGQSKPVSWDHAEV